MADSPQGKYYGGLVSAPAFRQIAQEILNYLEIPPKNPDEQLPQEPEKPEWDGRKIAKRKITKESSISEDSGGLRMPDVRGMTIRSVIDSLSVYALDFKFEGSGVAVSQSPEPGGKIETGKPCRVAFKRKDA
jgi:hypothetical protein